MTALHVVALSGGKDSTAMALRLKQLHPTVPFVYTVTPTGDELPEMFDHWKRLSRLLHTPLTIVAHPRQLRGLIDDQRALPNWRQRWCTRRLKIEPYAAFLTRCLETHAPVVSYVGLRADEPERESGDYSLVAGVISEYPLRDWGWNLEDVLRYLEDHGVAIPKRTDCARCFFQTLPEWYNLWHDHRDIFEDACLDEDWTGRTFRSPGRDTWPASLRDLAREFEVGHVPKPRRDLINEMKCRACKT